MRKHILNYSDKLNEAIGKGSVLLIKGKPTENGRHLYVTTIDGFIEIKPGLKMVFISDVIYRVKHKGGDQFSGIRVRIQSEAGLKGVLNMKRSGRPSVVLNNNKTPFHWITLKHTDIGTALRSIGSGLFASDLILESKQESIGSLNIWIFEEFIKKVKGEASAINDDIEVLEKPQNFDIEDVDPNGYDDYIHPFAIGLRLSLNNDRIPDHLKDIALEVGYYNTHEEEFGAEFLDFAGISQEKIDVYIDLESSYLIERVDDYFEQTEVETRIEDIFIGGDEIDIKMVSGMTEFNSAILHQEGYDILNIILGKKEYKP